MTKSLTGTVMTVHNNTLMVQVPQKRRHVPLAGNMHVMCFPPFDHLPRYLDAYALAKTRHPTISSVFIVPNTAKYVQHFSTWRLLEVTKQRNLLPDGNRPDRLMAVYTDVPADDELPPATLSFKSGSHSFVVQGLLNGHSAPVLIDTGATGTAFVSASYCRQHGIPIVNPYSQPLSVTLGDDRSVPTLGYATILVRFNQYKCNLQCMVLEALPQFPLILGDDWLKSTKADLSYYSNSISISTPHGARVSLKVLDKATCTPSPDSQILYITNYQHPIPPSNPTPLTPAQVSRAIRKNQLDDCFLLMVTQADDGTITLNSPSPTPSSPDVWTNAVPGTSKSALLMRALLLEYSDLFKETLPDLPAVRQPREVIPLQPGQAVPNRPMFRYTQAEQEEMRRQVTDLLSQGLIQKSSSPFGAPVLFVKKKDGSMRMCVDYRGLNKITVPNRYPLPRIDDLLDRLQGATVFSSLDLLSGYHQIRLVDSDVPKTAFRTPSGLYEYRVMPFGLTNAPSVFMACMNDMLSHLPFCTVYLDDILIFSKSEDEHIQHVRQVLQILQDNQYYLKLKKCDFFKSQVTYLGHVVTPDGIKPDPKKLQLIEQWTEPQNLHDLRSFLGTANYFHRYVQNFAKIAAPLTALTGVKVSKRKSSTHPIPWSPQCAQAFQTLKSSLLNAKPLKIPDLNKPFQLITDASDYALGAILIQDGAPVAFESRMMNPSERNYSTTDKELLAVVHALKLWRCYLQGSSFKVLTDHRPITYLKTQPFLNPRQVRWSQVLSEYNFDFDYIPGPLNPADSLSRLRVGPPQPTVLVMTKIPASHVKSDPPPVFQGISMPELLAAYRDIVDWEAEATRMGYDKDLNGVYWHKGCVVLPSLELQTRIMHLCHSTPYSGHFGFTRTLELVQRLYWWPGITRSVRRFVKCCDSCQRIKPSTQAKPGLLHPLPVPDRKWLEVSMDFITDLPPASEGSYDSVLVFVDKLSKMVHFAPCFKTCTATQAAMLFYQHVYRLHGMPAFMIHDRGTQFTSVFWKELFSLCQVDQRVSSAYHPESDGQTERVNRVLEDYLRHYIDEHQDNWVQYLPFAEFAYNNSVHESTQTTPFRLNYGYDPLTPSSFLSEPHIEHQVEQLQRLEESTKCPQAFEVFRDFMHRATSLARQRLLDARQRQKLAADKKRRDVSFSVGTKVLLSTRNVRIKASGSRKLLPRYIGPFTIKRIINPVAYELDLPHTLRIHNVFHVALLKPYYEDASYGFRYKPIPDIIDGQLEFEVEKLLDHRKSGRSYEYLVRWTGYGSESDSWEPEKVFRNSMDILTAYKQQHRLVKPPPQKSARTR